MSFRNDNNQHFENRIPRQPDNSQPFQNRMPFQNRFPVDNSRFRNQGDQRPPLVDNRLPYQDNSLQTVQTNRWENSSKGRFQDQTDSSFQRTSRMLPFNREVPPPSDEKPNYNNNKMQHFPDDRLNSSNVNKPPFQESMMMSYHGNFPQGNQKFAPVSGESDDVSLPRVNNNKIQQNRFPQNEQLAPPNEMLNSDSDILMNKGISRQPCPPFLPIPPRPQIGVSNFQMDVENHPIPLQPPIRNPILLNSQNLNVNTQMLGNFNLPAQSRIQNTKENQLMPKTTVPPTIPNIAVPNIRFPPPSLNNSGPSHLRFPPPSINNSGPSHLRFPPPSINNSGPSNLRFPPPSINNSGPSHLRFPPPSINSDGPSHLRFPPPSINSGGPSQLRFPVNVKHSFPPPSFVPGKEVIVRNSSSVTPQLFCPQSSPDLITKYMKAEYKETMVNIVKKWTESRNSFSTVKCKEKQYLKIHKFKENLKVFVGLIEKLRILNDSLAGHMEAEQTEWDTLVEDVTKTKNEVVNLQYTLFNSEQMKFITIEQKNRKKKRDRIRRKKKVQSEKYVLSLSKRIKLNEEIDAVMQKEHTKIVMEKMVESLKNEAGESLVQVKRKQIEVSEFINVFNLLKQLRDIRKETAIYQGFEDNWRCRC